MKGYRTFKTTMGHKIRVRMSEEEIVARWIYRFVLVTAPFVGSVLLMTVWMAVGR